MPVKVEGSGLSYIQSARWKTTKSVRNWTPNRAEVDSACLGREPEPPFGPRERTFLGSYPVVPCGPRKVEVGRYGTATPDCRANTPDQTQSSAIHTRYRR